MADKNLNSLIIGSLLHDIGKIVHRSGNDGRNHSVSGADWLREECGFADEAVLNCVAYHHGWRLKSANLPSDDFAYIVYMADNIASAADRRTKNIDDESYDEPPFSKDARFETVFNLLNGSGGRTKYYDPILLAESPRSALPVSEPRPYDESFYAKALGALSGNIREITLDGDGVASLLEILEGNLSYIPSTTGREQIKDISLYDHVKITAAVAGCLYQYLGEADRNDFRAEFFGENADAFYAEDFALLYSLDMSGIQNFIYTIRSEGALKSLRGRSFYLEIMMEHLADTLLESLGLSRANLLYSGGGHFYMLLPNTAEAKRRIEQFENETNTWLIDNFSTTLYVAGGYASCSKNTLENEPTGSYAALYRTASSIISEKKMHRYTKEQIIALNGIRQEGRECRTCKLVFADSGEDGEGKDCPLCESMKGLSIGVTDADFFAILKGDAGLRARLPGGMYVEAIKDEAKAREMQKNNDSFVRIYGKNKYYRGKGIRTRLWVGNYSKESELGKYAEREWTRVVQEDGSRGTAVGIKRLGVLRMDVDNLGEAFVTGFSKAGPKYNTISRTAAFSRQLSMFFKHDINSILSEKNRKATIIYSGGDDVFLVGAWDDVIEFAVDLRTQFGLFSQGKLTLSAGIGLYPGKFPIHVMARETGELEDLAKQNASPAKDSVVLFGKNERYGWDDYIKDVKEEKYETVKTFFDSSDERGNAFLYKLLDLIRDRKKKISLARWVYLLARLEPPKDDTAKRDAFRVFAEKLKTWFDEDEDARKLATALQLYVYENRKGGD